MTRLLWSALTTGSLLLSVATPSAAQNQTEGLHSLFVKAGKLYFGTATETNNFNDAAYQAIVKNKNEFGMYTPENSQKWEVTEPQKGKFVFTGADAVAAQAEANGQLLRCHTLTWHSQLPSFVSTTAWTPSTLTALLKAHITAVMTHFSGSCYAWDVVNEALNEDGTFRESVFLQVLGESYLPLSFRLAAAADPAAKLYYNDFNLETTKAKADGAVKIVKMVQDAGEKIDGVGFQAHLNVGQTPSRKELAATLNRFTALGVEVALTELDIAHTSLPASDADNEQQAEDYVSAVGACLDVKGCVGVTVWQFTDKFSWVPSTFPGKGEACLYTDKYEKKKAYTAVFGLLREAAAAVQGGDGGNAGNGSGNGNGGNGNGGNGNGGNGNGGNGNGGNGNGGNGNGGNGGGGASGTGAVGTTSTVAVKTAATEAVGGVPVTGGGSGSRAVLGLAGVLLWSGVAAVMVMV